MRRSQETERGRDSNYFCPKDGGGKLCEESLILALISPQIGYCPGLALYFGKLLTIKEVVKKTGKARRSRWMMVQLWKRSIKYCRKLLFRRMIIIFSCFEFFPQILSCRWCNCKGPVWYLCHCLLPPWDVCLRGSNMSNCQHLRKYFSNIGTFCIISLLGYKSKYKIFQICKMSQHFQPYLIPFSNQWPSAGNVI